jgi:single-strand DNA-binding protein
VAGDTVITVVGNLTADPELKFTPSGAAVANFTVASTPRMFDRQTSEWKDGDTLFLRCNIWRQAAENVAETLQRGMRVIVQGRLKQRSYETKEGEKRTVFELEVDEIGPSLRSATATIEKNNRGGNAGGNGWSGSSEGRSDSRDGGGGRSDSRDGSESRSGGGGGRSDSRDGSESRSGGGGGRSSGRGSAPADDPWAPAPASSGGGDGGWGSWPAAGNGQSDEPPF